MLLVTNVKRDIQDPHLRNVTNTVVPEGYSCIRMAEGGAKTFLGVKFVI